MQQDALPPIQIYSTLSRRTTLLETIEPGKVRMYVCGVTVYDHAHIGHGMSSITFDVIRRYLIARGYDVLYAQNFTDIDDKIINRANQEGIDPLALSEAMIAEWAGEMDALNVLPASITPRATEEIPTIVAMIERLVRHGKAYEAEGDVYFRVRSDEEYGKLSGRNIDEMVTGTRIAPDEAKDDPLDFALWKAGKPGEPTWPSPWSAGRPGWHIECSAMCAQHLGQQIDIHGGGRDLIFPHHENEIAQSEAYTEEEPFVRYWMHNGMLTIDGEKMSKSIGNVVPLRQIIDAGMAIPFRLQVLSSHYRAPLNWTREGLEAANQSMHRIWNAVEAPVSQPSGPRDAELEAIASGAVARFHAAMSDDFDTPNAMAAVYDLVRAINRAKSEPTVSTSVTGAQQSLGELLDILGIPAYDTSRQPSEAAPFIDLLLEVRNQLRASRQFGLADEIRDELTKRGVTIEDTRQGARWTFKQPS